MTGSLEGRSRVGLAVGELVVYGSHGVGRVVARLPAAGDRQEAVLVEFGGGLTVTLPLELAAVSMRRLVEERELVAVAQVLRSERPVDSQSWTRRLRALRETVGTGEATGWAEIARDGIRGEHRRGKTGGGLSAPSERRLYLQARALLAAEIAAVREIDLNEADAWIVEQVTDPPAEADAG